MASGDVRDLREAREQLRRVVSRVEEDHPDMALQMRDLLAGSIDTLQGDKQLLELLQASIESNLSTIFHMLINDIDLQALKPPTAAVEYAVRLAQRDIPLSSLTRAYYLAQSMFLRIAMDEVERLELPDGRRLEVVRGLANTIHSYIDWMLQVPWNARSKVKKDLLKAQEVLDIDHYGLERVKDRILEYLAVQSRVSKIKGPILCLVGPPGVGKTSLARSIAKAINRKFTRISLGGVRDEAEIRGHRRTYIGAMPGRIIHGMQTCGCSNPVFLLDEVDKMNADFRGDPASALLEVLDPEQNCNFSDHYIEFPFDLSNVFWIVTANTVETIPPALLDRMEVIQLASYTDDEKVKIAELHLIPKERELHGLTEKTISFTQEAVFRTIRDYTREAGVRNLERKIAAICRKAAHRLVTEKTKRVLVNAKTLHNFLGPIIFLESDLTAKSEIGICTGLAWTSIGGELLKVEVAATAGKGGLLLTGQLGDVMKESAQAGYTYIRSRAKELGLDEKFYENTDVHIHLPEGAIPKDGPSAGITMVTAMVSALTGKHVKAGLAMTGEITLSGRVLPVGGIKEKMLAANRYGVKTILLPKLNIQDLEELPKNVRNAINFIPVSHMDEVLKLALED